MDTSLCGPSQGSGSLGYISVAFNDEREMGLCSLSHGFPSSLQWKLVPDQILLQIQTLINGLMFCRHEEVSAVLLLGASIPLAWRADITQGQCYKRSSLGPGQRGSSKGLGWISSLGHHSKGHRLLDSLYIFLPAHTVGLILEANPTHWGSHFPHLLC